ncbi:MAG: iron-containing alcohol dehydrogenase [Planctomycetales bacterium]|nr:iron-containing alcohol dehydrogenase [Planctomycetales bacterium]
MESIDFQHATRLVFGANSIQRLGELSLSLNVSRALVVSDPGVVAAGHFQRGVDALVSAGIEVHAFHGVRENPSTREVEAGLLVAKQTNPDLLIGLGGGSSMDCAKGINFLYSCGGQMQDYWGVGKATKDMLPMIAVPTTAGTGSEAQSFALISHPETHTKMACGDRRAACKIALLDPELTITQPPRVTALTGIDAISHALESYVTRRRNALSVCYSRQAWQLLSHGFPRVLSQPTDLEARGLVQLGAFFSGLAIETSMLGAAHALANPLTARFGITHGQAVGLMLPQVIRFNGHEVEGMYEELWRDVAHTPLGETSRRSTCSDSLSEFVRQLVAAAGLETQLSQLGIEENAIDQLAQDATSQWTGTFNPRSLTQADFRDIYFQTFTNGKEHEAC